MYRLKIFVAHFMILKRSLVVVFLPLFLVSATAHATENGFPIAGLNPSERPAGAPEILTVVRSPQWFRDALTGVTQPYPKSLGFLEDQGNWYTPFIEPGMTGPYDIRNWHVE